MRGEDSDPDAAAALGDFVRFPSWITRNGDRHVFDSFECAIHAMAPTCSHCGCRIVGHGLESNGSMFCCANCARQSGEMELQDRA